MALPAKDILAQMIALGVYEQARNRLETYSYYLVRDREIARDIVSNAVAAVLQSNTQLEENGLYPYLLRCVHNLSLNHRRDSARRGDKHSVLFQRERSAFDSYTKVLESCVPSGILISEISVLFENTLALLPEDVRDTYLLRNEGLSYKKISLTLGIKLNKVDKNLRKALAALRKTLSDYL